MKSKIDKDTVLQGAKALLTGFLLSLAVSADFSSDAVSASEAANGFFLQLGRRFGNYGPVHVLAALSLAAVIWYVSRPKEKNVVRGNPWAWIACGLLGILNALGYQMYYTDHFPATLISGFIAALYAAGCALIAYYVISLAFFLVKKAYVPGEPETGRKIRRKWFLIAFGVILAGWLPWIITYYPASADWDVYLPISEYLDIMGFRNNQHPWFYCCTVGFFYKLGVDLGDKNVGMFLYIILRALAMSGIYAWLVVRLRDFGVRKIVLAGVILFYTLVPVWGAYAKHSFKDTQGAAFFCWYILLTVECVREIRAGNRRPLNMILYSFAALLMSLYRNNCIYVAAPTTLLLMIAIFAQKKYDVRKKLVFCLILIAGMGVYEGYEYYIYHVEQIGKIPVVEALSLPVQQTARTVRDNGDIITEQEKEVISAVLDYDALPEKYDPLISDPVKWTFIQIQENVIRYLKTWVKMAFRYPVSYLEAAVSMSYGYYAFTPDQAEYAGNMNCGMTIFDWTKDTRFSEELTCDYVESMKGARKALDGWAKIWHGLPVIGWTDIKAIYTWVIVFAGALLLRKKQWLNLIPVCAFLLMFLSCCVSPVNDCFRYFAPIAAASPALMLLHPGRTGLKS